MRPNHAPWPLLDTPRTVTQVAFECGFSDGSHFARWFKRAYGESPYQFRHRRRQAATL
jgi:AraC-like DNA-binding protein